MTIYSNRQGLVIATYTDIAAFLETGRIPTWLSFESDTNKIVTDTFGMRKLIIVVSSSGIVSGLDSLTGKKIWKRQLSQTWSPDSSEEYVVKSVETTRDAVVKYPPTISVIASKNSKSKKPVT